MMAVSLLEVSLEHQQDGRCDDSPADPTVRQDRRQLARRRAQILLRHYLPSAVSPLGRAMASRLEQDPENVEAEHFLLQLPPEAFTSYVQLLRDRSGWDEETVQYVLDHTAIVEASNGCPYDCAMCYIDAPRVNGSLPWPQMREILHHLARRHRAIVADEAVDVLTSDALGGQRTEPANPLDVALALARHRRNRFNHFSDHLMLYWRSNPTSWRDPLFNRHFGHLAEEVRQSFQIVDVARLVEHVQKDAAMRRRYEKEFGGDPVKLRDATTLHAIASTVPYAKGSLNDQAVQYMLQRGIASDKLLRVSAPHVHLMPSRARNPDHYWQDLRYTLKSANPKVVYLFCRNIQELEELATHLAASLEHSDRPWWIESRLALYELREKRARGWPDGEIALHLKKHLKRLSFLGNAEGRAKDIDSPFFTRRGTVMCVNGVVLTSDGIAFQSCTTPERGDREEGKIFPSLQGMTAEQVRLLIRQHPLVNRARESVTPNLDAIPLDKRRPAVDWFEQEQARLRRHPLYAAKREQMQACFEQARPFLRLT
jgi:hypothetical protein